MGVSQARQSLEFAWKQGLKSLDEPQFRKVPDFAKNLLFIRFSS